MKRIDAGQIWYSAAKNQLAVVDGRCRTLDIDNFQLGVFQGVWLTVADSGTIGDCVRLMHPQAFREEFKYIGNI